jgi:hypothetical protein
MYLCHSLGHRLIELDDISSSTFKRIFDRLMKPIEVMRCTTADS